MAAPIKSCVSLFSRLSIQPAALACRVTGVRSFVTANGPNYIRSTPSLCAEPMKKKKKVDANVMNQREQKRKRKLEKAIRQLVKKGRPLKPIQEIEGDRTVMKTLDVRRRENVSLSFEQMEERALLHKDWARYKLKDHRQLLQQLNQAMASQQRALNELRAESEELYQLAVQIDPELVPFDNKGPLATPPIKDYDSPDGDYHDTTKLFDK